MRPLQWGLPAGFDIPVYGADVESWPNRNDRSFDVSRWLPPPPGLCSQDQLAERGLRPHNTLCPDALLVGPAHVEGVPVAIDWATINLRDPDFHTEVLRRLGGTYDHTYPCTALYREAAARPLVEPPTVADRTHDRQEAACWALSVLDDPAALIMEVVTLSTFDEGTEPTSRAVVCELTVMATDGSPVLTTLINPQWEHLPADELNACGLSAQKVDAAPIFEQIREELEELLRGRRVVSFGRDHTYSALFCELEWCHFGTWDWWEPQNDGRMVANREGRGQLEFSSYGFESGTLLGDHLPVLEVLGRSRFECAQLAYSRHAGVWDDQHRPVLQVRRGRKRRAGALCRDTLDLIQTMADPVRRYRDLCAQVESAERAGRDRRRTTTSADRRVRLDQARAAVRQRATACENPELPGSGLHRGRHRPRRAAAGGPPRRRPCNRWP
jgi:hypothetical protein